MKIGNVMGIITNSMSCSSKRDTLKKLSYSKCNFTSTFNMGTKFDMPIDIIRNSFNALAIGTGIKEFIP